MIMRNFSRRYLKEIYNVTHSDNIEIVSEKSEEINYCVYTEIIFKIVDEWRFYRMYVQQDMYSGETKFASGASNEWSDGEIIECTQMVPHVTQVVVYDEARPENAY
jgi:hypothetical protein